MNPSTRTTLGVLLIGGALAAAAAAPGSAAPRPADDEYEGTWRISDTSGVFQFMLGGPNTEPGYFEGTYAAPGDTPARMWSGARETEGDALPVPCRWPS